MAHAGIYSCPLTKVPLGATVRIVSIDGASGQEKRLREMGFVNNARLTKIAQQGAIICQLGSTRVILSQALAENIFVDSIATPQNMTMTLDQLKSGQKAKIINFTALKDSVLAMQEMGLTAGQEIKFVRTAPLGDPIEVSVRGFSLSLRLEEAKNILVEVLP